MVLDRSVAPPAQSIQHVDLIEATTHYLSNGVPVHIIRAGKQPVVGIEIVFRQGGIKHESRDASCFFALKMLSEGTRYRNAYQLSNFVDSFGAYLQLAPGLDRSSVEIYSLSKHIDALLGLLKEILTEPVFPEAELAKLKAIQKQHIRVSNEKSNVVASKKMKAVLFGEDQPYGKSLTEASIDGLTRQDLVGFYENNLRSHWEVILSGDVTEDILASVERHLGQVSLADSNKLSSTHTVRFLPVSKGNLIERPDSLQSSLRVGMPLFKKDAPDYHVMRVTNTILGGYFGSRLMRNIREEKGLTYGISSGVVTLEDEGYLVIGTEVKKKFTQLALDEIYQEIDRLRREPVGVIELNTVKNYLVGKLLNSVDTPFALAEKFKNIYMYGLTYDFYQNYLKTLDTITPEQIQAVANRYLITEDMREVIVGGYR